MIRMDQMRVERPDLAHFVLVHLARKRSVHTIVLFMLLFRPAHLPVLCAAVLDATSKLLVPGNDCVVTEKNRQ